MERVCEVADIAQATLYRKFPDKFSLLKAVLMAPDPDGPRCDEAAACSPA
ncbi:hypothetical protein [Xanthomonas arboricola]